MNANEIRVGQVVAVQMDVIRKGPLSSYIVISFNKKYGTCKVVPNSIHEDGKNVYAMGIGGLVLIRNVE